MQVTITQSMQEVRLVTTATYVICLIKRELHYTKNMQCAGNVPFVKEIDFVRIIWHVVFSRLHMTQHYIVAHIRLS